MITLWRYLVHLSDFLGHCDAGRCCRKLQPSKGCIRETKRVLCYEKFTKQQHKEQCKKTQTDTRWEQVRRAVLQRDKGQCRVWYVLTPKERAFVMNHFRADFVMLQDIDCAHVEGRNAAPEHKYNPDMIFSICRYFHGLLDTYHDPVTRDVITRAQHDQWWDRIRSGRITTSPYGGIPQ